MKKRKPKKITIIKICSKCGHQQGHEFVAHMIPDDWLARKTATHNQLLGSHCDKCNSKKFFV